LGSDATVAACPDEPLFEVPAIPRREQQRILQGFIKRIFL
jgi:hypothetical protein